MNNKPSVGRIVHYVSYGTPGGEYGKECRAAIVTRVDKEHPDIIGLAILNPTGMFFAQVSIKNDGEFRPNDPTDLCGELDFGGGTWHWPARTL